MFNVTLKDNERVSVSGVPQTATGNPTTAFNFNVANPNPALLDVSIAMGANPDADPSFVVTPKDRFYGPDRVVTLTLTGLTENFGAGKATDMTVTVQGSLPDDGKLDHFAPLASEPVAQ